MMKLIWTRHAIQRGYSRIGKKHGGMDRIANKILKNINKARPNRQENSALVPFKVGKERCIAVIVPEGKDGKTAVVKSVYTITQEKHRAIFSKNKS